MWCKNCNIETNEDICPICGEFTIEDIPVEVYWCDNCKTPVVQTVNQVDRGICPICGGQTRYMAADLRPVFPEERLLLELLLKRSRMHILKSQYGQQIVDIILMEKVLQSPVKLFRLRIQII